MGHWATSEMINKIGKRIRSPAFVTYIKPNQFGVRVVKYSITYKTQHNTKWTMNKGNNSLYICTLYANRVEENYLMTISQNSITI